MSELIVTTGVPAGSRLSESDVLAPFVSLPAEMRDMLDHVGPRWTEDVPGNIARVVAAYTQVAARSSIGSDVAVQRDVPYGPHERQRMDIFVPGTGSRRDVLMFVHGGAFVRGDKRATEALYDNVCQWFAKRGIVAINVEYRLANDAPYPGGSEDVGEAARFVSERAAGWGADPKRIFLMGHSAGGTHVAAYCCDPSLSTAFDRAPVAGAILVSARLRADVLPDNPNAFAVLIYYGADDRLHEALSPMAHARNFRVPALVAIAQYENPHLDEYGAEMMARLLAGPARHRHRFIQLMRHNHLSIVAHFNTGEELLGREVLDFMRAA